METFRRIMETQREHRGTASLRRIVEAPGELHGIKTRGVRVAQFLVFFVEYFIVGSEGSNYYSFDMKLNKQFVFGKEHYYCFFDNLIGFFS